MKDLTADDMSGIGKWDPKTAPFFRLETKRDIVDCTNFVSGALFNGGWPMARPTGGSEPLGISLRNPLYWFVDTAAAMRLKYKYLPVSAACSRTWIFAPALAQFLDSSGRAEKVGQSLGFKEAFYRKLQAGDVLSYSEHGSVRSVEHMMLVSEPFGRGKKGRGAIVQHTGSAPTIDFNHLMEGQFAGDTFFAWRPKATFLVEGEALVRPDLRHPRAM